MVRNRQILKTLSSPQVLFFPVSASVPQSWVFFLLPNSSSAGRMGHAAHNSSSLPPLPPHASPWSIVGAPPSGYCCAGRSYRLGLFTNCSRVCPLHGVQSFRNRLLHCGSLIWHSSCQKKLSELFCMVHSSCQDPAPVWVLHGLQLPSGHIHFLWHGVFRGLRCEYLLWHGHPWAVWGQHRALLHRLLGNLLRCLEHLLPMLPPCHPSSLALVSAILFLSHFFSVLLSVTADGQHLLPFFKYGVAEVPQALLLGWFSSGQQWVCFGASWNWLYRAQGQPRFLLTEATRTVPLQLNSKELCLSILCFYRKTTKWVFVCLEGTRWN